MRDGQSSSLIRLLEARDIETIVAAFNIPRLYGNKPASQYERYLAEQAARSRVVLVAYEGEAFVGHLTIVWESGYPPFASEGIPELQDFNVLVPYRRRGVGTRLMDAAERRVAAQGSPVVGIGVGMDPDYGPAQRLYVRRGYVPDGRGLTWGDRFVHYGDEVTVDDSLVLHLTKELK